MWQVKAVGKASPRHAARHKHEVVVLLLYCKGDSWDHVEKDGSRACDGSIGGGKTQNGIGWEPGYMELQPRWSSLLASTCASTCMCMSMSTSLLLDDATCTISPYDPLGLEQSQGG
jgi:hypothetical protein